MTGKAYCASAKWLNMKLLLGGYESVTLRNSCHDCPVFQEPQHAHFRLQMLLPLILTGEEETLYIQRMEIRYT